jgi:hypothetical protein
MTSIAAHADYAKTASAPGLARSGYWVLPLIVIGGAAIRLYLSFTSYCISGDGAAYIEMARQFAAGDWREPLSAVFSPLYPLLISLMHRLVPDWELAGNLVSAALGTGAIVTVFLLMREVYGRREIAWGAAALTAIHPDLAAYSASVRTEAGYIFLTTAGVWLIIKAARDQQIATAVIAGLITGIAYLYRTEAIGFIGLGAAYLLASALYWQRCAPTRAALLCTAFVAPALIMAGPYLLFLHSATGHWTVGRELGTATMLSIGGVASDPGDWRRLAFARHATPLAMIAHDPQLYFAKIRADFIASFYNFFQAANPLIIILLGCGLWYRGRRIVAAAPEAFLATLIAFYFCGFALSQTGSRFMIHLIPYTFGWVIIGIEGLSTRLQQFAGQRGVSIAQSIPAVLIASILLPETLWPIGYDMRGVRYAGEIIAARNPAGAAVIARDGRVAWYAGARFIALPAATAPLCDWIAAQRQPGFMLISESDEHRFAITPATSCLEIIRRYPRAGAKYYDLFAIRESAVPGRALRERALPERALQ